MKRFPIPFPIVLAGVSVAMVLYACGQDGPGFGPGGTSSDDSLVPSGDDTGEPDDTGDTGADDTQVVDDTGDTAPVIDTSPPYEGEGYNRGDVAYNLVAPDQYDNTWRLYQHDGAPVVLVFGYGQSYNFQDICSWLPDIQSEFSSYGVDVAVMMFLDPAWVDTTAGTARGWAETYDLDTVLYDPDAEARYDWASPTQVRTYLIDGDMLIQWTNDEATSQEQLRQKIGDLVY